MRHKPQIPRIKKMSTELLQTQKELASRLNRSRQYVLDMERAGFRLPATETEAVNFLRRHQHPSRYRKGRHHRQDDDD
jgi:DNA-binding XRE family transcriptional regulator